MTSFRTELIVKPAPFSLTHQDNLLTIGSCFADQIGERLSGYKFACQVNPAGTLYHPLAIHNTIKWGIDELSLNDKHFIRHEEVWNHFDFHSRWSALDDSTLRQHLERLKNHLYNHLHDCSTVIITYGTAWGYRYQTTGAIVANCHKVPQQEFVKELTSVQQVLESFTEMRERLVKIKPDIRFILTVSPVRHVRDTLELNYVSKATLRLACYEIAKQFSNVSYFPSYEIMMDDLRDYRFYEKDLIHPNDVAIDYLWEKFSTAYLTEDARKIIVQYSEIKSALHHRPYHPQGKAHQKFLKNLLEKAERLAHQIPMENEIKSIRSQLTINS